MGELPQLPLTELMTLGLIVVIPLLVVLFWLAATIRIVPEHQRLAVYRLGRYLGERGPGIVLVLPVIDRAVKIDLRNQMAQARTPAMTGVIGQAVTDIHADGSVMLAGQTWQAVSQQPIPAGARVRVKRVLLEVDEF